MHGPHDDHSQSDDVVPLHLPFETAMRGFNRQQVLDHIESLEGQITIMGADRDSALKQLADLSRVVDHLRRESEMLAHLRRETEKANAQVERMQRSPMVAAGHRIQNIVRLAEEEAAELRANAQREVAELRAKVQKDVTDLRGQTDREVSAQRTRASSEADKLHRETERRCRQLESESEQRRKSADQETRRELERREKESAERIKQRETRSTAGVYTMLRMLAAKMAERIATVEATEAELERTRDHATQELKALEAVRSEIAGRLTSTHDILEKALDEVEPNQSRPDRNKQDQNKPDQNKPDQGNQPRSERGFPAQRISLMDKDPVIGERTVQITRPKPDERRR